MSSWTYSNQGAFVYRNICWNLGCRKTKLECGCSNTNVPPRAMIKKIAKAVLASMGTLPRQGLQWLRESLGVEFRFEMVSLMQGSTFWWAALLVVFCFRSVHITLHVYHIMRCLAWLKKNYSEIWDISIWHFWQCNNGKFQQTGSCKQANLK